MRITYNNIIAMLSKIHSHKKRISRSYFTDNKIDIDKDVMECIIKSSALFESIIEHYHNKFNVFRHNHNFETTMKKLSEFSMRVENKINDIEKKQNMINFNNVIFPWLVKGGFFEDLQKSNNSIVSAIDNRMKTKFKLCVEPTQFTNGKTEQTLNKICRNQANSSMSSTKHHLDIIATNKSLSETTQWKIRAINKFNNLSQDILSQDKILVDILSSNNDSSFNNISDYIVKFIKANKKSELPNILIICYHAKRVLDDLFELFKCFPENKLLLNKYKMNISLYFDEPDANISITSKFLKKLNEHKECSNMIRDITFITATPFENFWDTLEEFNITKLINTNSKSKDGDYDSLLEKYRMITDHNFIPLNNLTENPLEYIKDAFEKYIKDEIGTVILAPAHLYTIGDDFGSHEEVVKFFIEKKYCVFLSNGSFKGFITSRERISLDEFNKKNNVNGELRESLIKWKQLNPKENLAITGNLTIERGISLISKPFVITHAIFSMYHNKQLNKLVQMFGRTTGHKDYVDVLTIICPQEIYDNVNNYVSNTIKIRKRNPETYCKDDFCKITNDIILSDNPELQKIIVLDNKDTKELEDVRNKKLLKSIVSQCNTISKYVGFEREFVNATKHYKEWNIEEMLKPNAITQIVNIPEDKKNKNVLMIYLYDGKLIVNPWQGLC